MSTHIDRNQTVISHLKNISSGKSENDFAPQKQSALKQLQAVGSAMEDKSDSLKDEMEQLQELLKNFGGSKTEVRLIASLFKKINEQMGEMHKLHGDIQAQSQAIDTATSDENVSDDSGDSVGAGRPLPPPIPPPLPPTPPDTSAVSSISIGSGAQVIAARILLELQEEYSKLQALLQQILQNNLSHSVAIVQALSSAAQDSMAQEANNQRLEARTYTTQAATAGATIGFTGLSAVGQNRASKPYETTKAELDQHENLLSTPSNDARMNNQPAALTDDEVRRDAYINRLKHNDFSMRSNEGQVRHHAYGALTSDERTAIAKNLNEKQTQNSNSLQSVHTKFSRYESTFNNLGQVTNNTAQSMVKGYEADNTTAKGRDEARRTISQDTNEKQNQAISKNRDDVNSAAQDGKKALDVRNAIIQDNHGTKG